MKNLLLSLILSISAVAVASAHCGTCAKDKAKADSAEKSCCGCSEEKKDCTDGEKKECTEKKTSAEKTAKASGACCPKDKPAA